jgi:hypothetical protein
MCPSLQDSLSIRAAQSGHSEAHNHGRVVTLSKSVRHRKGSRPTPVVISRSERFSPPLLS